MTRLGHAKSRVSPKLRKIQNATVQMKQTARDLHDLYRSDDIVGAMVAKSQAERSVDDTVRKCDKLPSGNEFCKEFQKAVEEMRKTAQEFGKCKCPK